MKQPCHNSQLSRNCQKHADSWRKTTFQFLSGIKISLSVPNWCLDWWVWYKLSLSLQHTSHKVCFCKENTPNGGIGFLKMALEESDVYTETSRWEDTHIIELHWVSKYKQECVQSLSSSLSTLFFKAGFDFLRWNPALMNSGPGGSSQDVITSLLKCWGLNTRTLTCEYSRMYSHVFLQFCRRLDPSLLSLIHISWCQKWNTQTGLMLPGHFGL